MGQSGLGNLWTGVGTLANLSEKFKFCSTWIHQKIKYILKVSGEIKVSFA